MNTLEIFIKPFFNKTTIAIAKNGKILEELKIIFNEFNIYSIATKYNIQQINIHGNKTFVSKYANNLKEYAIKYYKENIPVNIV